MAIKFWWTICIVITNSLAISPVSMLENATKDANVPERDKISSVDKNILEGN